METTVDTNGGLRPVVGWTVAVCLAVAAAPWLSGGQEPVALVISALALLLGSLLLWRQPVARRFSLGPLAGLYGAFIGWAALSLIWSANRYSTVMWLVVWILAGVVFRLAYTLAGEVDGRRRLIGLYIASAAVFSLYGIYLYLTGGYDRLTSSLYWANPAAAYLIPAILIGLDRQVRTTSRWRWGWTSLTLLFGGAFLLTESRGGTAVLALLIAIFSLTRIKSKRYWIHLVFTSIAAILLSIGLTQWRHQLHSSSSAPTNVGSRFVAAAEGERQSTSDRIVYLKSSVAIWAAHPLLGTGAGTFGDVHPKYQERVVSAGASAHNVYLQTLAELGLFGALLLAYALVIMAFGVARGLVYPSRDTAVMFGLAGLLLHFGLDIDVSYPALVLLAAVLTGYLYYQRPAPARAFSWRTPAVAALVLVPVISSYQSSVWADRGRAAQDDGDFPQAAADFGQAHQGLVYNPDTLNAEGINFYAVATGPGSDAKAAARLALDRALASERLDPADAQHHQLEGRVRELSGDATGAERAFLVALELDPYNHPEYALDLANLQATTGHPADAIATARSMLAQYPPSVVANRNADTTLPPTLGDLHALIANVYLATGDLSAAQSEAKAGLAIDKDNLRCRAVLVQVGKRETQ